MLMLQVIQVNELFQQIERSKKSQWQEVCQENFTSKSPSKLRKNTKIFNSLKGRIQFSKLLKKEYNNNDSQKQLDLAVGLNEKFNQEIKENFESKLKKNTFLNKKKSETFENDCLGEKLCDSNLLRLTPEGKNLFHSESIKQDIFDETEFNCSEARSVLSQMENNYNLKMLSTKKRENQHLLNNKNFPNEPINSRKCFSNNKFSSVNTENSKNKSSVNSSFEEKSIGDSILEGKKSYEKYINDKPSFRSRSLESRRKSKLNVTFADETAFDIISYKENSLSDDDDGENELTDSSTLEDSEYQQYISSKNFENNYILPESDDRQYFSLANSDNHEELMKNNNNLNRSQSVYRLQNIDLYSPILELSENESDVNLKSNVPISATSIQPKAIAFTIPMTKNQINENFVERQKTRKNTTKIKESEKISQNEGEEKNLSVKNLKIEKNSPKVKRDKSPNLRPSSSHGKKEIQINDSNNSKSVNKKNKTEFFTSNNEKKSDDQCLGKKIEKQESRPSSVSSRKSQETGATKRISKSLERNNKKDKIPQKSTKVTPILPKKPIDSLKSLNSNETVIINNQNTNEKSVSNFIANAEQNSTEKIDNKEEIKNTNNDLKFKKSFFNSRKTKSEDTTTINNNSRSESLDRKKNSLKKRVIDSLSKLKSKSFVANSDGATQNLKIKKIDKNLKITKIDEKISVENNNNNNNSSIVTNIWPKGENVKNRIINQNNKRSRVCSKSVSQSILQTPNISNFPRYSKEAQRLLIKKYTKPINLPNASKFEKLKKFNNTKKREDSKEIKITPDFFNQKENKQIVKVEKSKNSNFIDNCFKSIVNENNGDCDYFKNENENKNLQISTFPLENSKFSDINHSRSPNSISLASYCDSETSITRMVLETSRIIQSNSTVEEQHFFANVLKRTNEECSLLKFDRCQSSNRENTMIAIRRDGNYGLMKFSPKQIQSKIESLNYNRRINVRYACDFLKSNRTLCRLSLYLYIYGMLSIILIFFKVNPCKYCFLGSGFF